MRTEIYDDMVADPQVIRDNQWPHTIGLLRVARETFCRTALATMSYRKEVLYVLRSLDIEDSLDEVLTREDVENPMPDPEETIRAYRTIYFPAQEIHFQRDRAGATLIVNNDARLGPVSWAKCAAG